MPACSGAPFLLTFSRRSHLPHFEWLRNTRLSDFAADVATVEVGDRVTAETLHRRFARDVERSLSERVGRPVTASFKAESECNSGEGRRLR